MRDAAIQTTDEPENMMKPMPVIRAPALSETNIAAIMPLMLAVQRRISMRVM